MGGPFDLIRERREQAQAQQLARSDRRNRGPACPSIRNGDMRGAFREQPAHGMQPVAGSGCRR